MKFGFTKQGHLYCVAKTREEVKAVIELKFRLTNENKAIGPKKRKTKFPKKTCPLCSRVLFGKRGLSIHARKSHNMGLEALMKVNGYQQVPLRIPV